jgi:hypothetical protein
MVEKLEEEQQSYPVVEFSGPTAHPYRHIA